MADEHLTEEDLARLESLGVGSLVTAGEFARLVAEVRRLRARVAELEEAGGRILVEMERLRARVAEMDEEKTPSMVGELIFAYYCDVCGRPKYGERSLLGTRCQLGRIDGSECPGKFR